jgi:hypothetical protein
MYRKIILALLVVALALVWLGSIGFAQTGDGFDLSWHVVGGGGAGGPLTGSGFSLRSTLGQAAVGTFSDASYWFGNGYWYGAINTAPSISGLPDVIVNHTTILPVSIDLWAYALDTETPDSGLTYTIEGAPPPGAGVSIVGNRWLTINPSTSWCGYTDVTVRVTDPGGLWDNDTLRVAVTWSCQG